MLATLPVIDFLLVNATTGMWPAIFASLGTAASVGLIQPLRKEKLAAAFVGLGTVLVTSTVAVIVGEAKGYYLLGNGITLCTAGVLMASFIVRRPLIGQVWAAANSQGTFWRTDKRSLFSYDLATFAWAILAFARFSVERWLYNTDETTWLGVARLAMGWPLTFCAVLGSILAVRKVDARRKLHDPNYPDHNDSKEEESDDDSASAERKGSASVEAAHPEATKDRS